MLILNLKNYERAAFRSGLEILEKVSEYLLSNPDLNNKVFFAPNFLDLGLFVDKFPGLNYIAQHVDLHEGEKTTGWVTPRSLERLGVDRVLLNHSEHRFDSLEDLVALANKLDTEGYEVVSCCENLDEARYIRNNANVLAVALEPPELIGTGKSVSNERPEVVSNFIKEFKAVPELTIVGAGVSTEEDVRKGVDLGVEGFIIASAFVNADDHLQKLQSFLSPML
jgi:triosephosphate isomerase